MVEQEGKIKMHIDSIQYYIDNIDLKTRGLTKLSIYSIKMILK